MTAEPSILATPTTVDTVEQLVEQLFRASDVETLADACSAFADARWPGSRVVRRAPDADSRHADTSRAVLARDAHDRDVLELVGPAAAHVDAEPWPWIARLVRQRLDQLNDLESLFGTVSRLAQAERLQRALFSIADLAATNTDTDRLMHSLHHTISTLMYADNFYVVHYDPVRATIRFPYHVSQYSDNIPAPTATLPLDAIHDSITWHMLRANQPLMGTPESLSRQLGAPLKLLGPPFTDWLGVPMRRGNIVIGGLAVMTFDVSSRYSEQDREVLTYVAQHLQTSLDRREATVELENRIRQRTRALRQTNHVLQEQVLERQRGERLQSALFRIAELTSGADSLDTFYAAIHHIVGTLIYAHNLYIALVSEDDESITFPYSVDEKDTQRPPRPRGNSITEYVLNLGKPLRASSIDIRQLTAAGDMTLQGELPHSWLGVPLIWDNKAMGVLAVQSYSPDYTYEARDQELLTFVSYHIANALQRRQANEELKRAYAEMERRVVERTRALALANRDLRKQVIERERIERRLKYETLHDQLTGLPNRALLLQRLETTIKHYREDPSRLFAVLFIDLDRFKVINDSVGHLVGDDLLFQVGGRIRNCLKSRDTVARLGGDEFAVLLEALRDEDAARHVAERIIDALHQPFHIGVKEIFTSASVGISLASSGYHRAEELLRDADSAMYSAKAGGRHRAATFDDGLRRQALELLEIENDLRRGLTRNAFVPYYQPIMDMRDGRTCGYEALLRWRHPERGVLIPGDFLQIAEESGCIEEIDWQIFAQVCHDARALTDTDGYVSINLSARHFRSSELEGRLLALLEAQQVPATRLRIEITEGTLLESPVRVKRALETFRSHGIRIVLDDFGTGYSSLSYMHQYPIEVLKIDQSFVVNLDESESNQANVVVRAILALANSLGIEVVAEGIETPLQEEVLMRMGCSYGQGFLFSRAQPARILAAAAIPDDARESTP
ncbi:MAG TPA: EAL domain-containing protein [Rhodanobacteraceae bacterium]